MNDRPPQDHANDPVLARRAQLAQLARLGQRLGYLAFLTSLVVFAIGLATRLTDTVVTSLVALMIVGSVLLAPAIVLHYAVRAAADEDRAVGR